MEGGDEVLDSGFSRKDVVRLITQSLHALGYHKSAEQLEAESQIPLLAPAVSEFRRGVLLGQWEHAAAQIPELQLESDEAVCAVRFLILEQKFLELVDDQQFAPALECLRTQLAPLGDHTDKLRRLAGFLLCAHSEDLRARCGWLDASEAMPARIAARHRLLSALQELIPPSVLIPENRLETLLLQAMAQQTSGGGGAWRAPSPALEPAPSPKGEPRRPRWNLFEDQPALVGAGAVPSTTTTVLDRHSDEVWYVAFSHDGERLASASKDHLVIIWTLQRDAHGEARPVPSEASGSSRTSSATSGADGDSAAADGVSDAEHILSGHAGAVSFLMWSPDDAHLLTCGNDCLVKLWSTKSGSCVRTFERHTDAVTACAWLPSGRHFLSGGLDKNVLVWDVEGDLLQSWHGLRVSDLVVCNQGEPLVAVCAEKCIRLYRLQMNNGKPKLCTSEEHPIPETDSITSVCLSRDQRYLLVNTTAEEMHVWDLDERALVNSYRGQKQARFVIRSAFGGHEDSYIVSGSEDSQIYVWNRHDASLLEVLPGHSGTAPMMRCLVLTALAAVAMLPAAQAVPVSNEHSVAATRSEDGASRQLSDGREPFELGNIPVVVLALKMTSMVGHAVGTTVRRAYSLAGGWPDNWKGWKTGPYPTGPGNTVGPGPYPPNWPNGYAGMGRKLEQSFDAEVKANDHLHRQLSDGREPFELGNIPVVVMALRMTSMVGHAVATTVRRAYSLAGGWPDNWQGWKTGPYPTGPGNTVGPGPYPPNWPNGYAGMGRN